MVEGESVVSPYPSLFIEILLSFQLMAHILLVLVFTNILECELDLQRYFDAVTISVFLDSDVD